MRVHRFKNENPYADIEVFICVKGTGEEEFLRRDGNLMGANGPVVNLGAYGWPRE